MKQLKFMLAAATAISLATAAQADLSVGPTSQNFDGSEENWQVGASVPGTNDNGFSYAATDGGNSSVIYQNAEDADNKTKVLNVDTSGQPLLFNVQGTKEGLAEDLGAEGTKSVVIETDVKFTVTAADQTVKAGDDDKLMIYLKQEGDIQKLKVCAAYYKEGGYDVQEGINISPTITPGAYDVLYADGSAVEVEAGAWYKLKVESLLFKGEPMFKITLGTKQLKPASVLNVGASDTAEEYYFPALTVGEKATSIQYVGFAGEGYVDNIVVTKEVNTPSTVDFTFAWTTDGISAVKYAIGAVTAETTFTLLPADTKKITGLNAADNITIQIEPAAWWAVKDNADLTYTASEKTASLDDFVTKLATVGEDGTVAVESTTTPAALNINEGSFVNETAGSTELAKVVKWATSKGGATAANIGTFVGNLNFANAEDTDAEKAYLLDCTEGELTGDDGEIAKFKFVGFDLTTGFTVGKDKQVANGAAYGNGYVEVRGATAVNGDYTEAANTAKHSFFKAFLVPFQPAAAEVE